MKISEKEYFNIIKETGAIIKTHKHAENGECPICKNKSLNIYINENWNQLEFLCLNKCKYQEIHDHFSIMGFVDYHNGLDSKGTRHKSKLKEAHIDLDRILEIQNQIKKRK